MKTPLMSALATVAMTLVAPAQPIAAMEAVGELGRAGGRPGGIAVAASCAWVAPPSAPTAVVPAKPGDPAESSDRDARGCSEDQVDAVKDRIREECDGLGGWALVVCSADGIDIIMEGCGEPPELITVDRS